MQLKILGISSLWLALFATVWAWNHDIFFTINHSRSELADQCIGFIGGFGDGLVVAIFMCLLMLLSLRAGMAGVLAFFLSGLLAQILKRLFEAPRPPVVLEHVYVLGDSLSRHSFPSGHATSLGVMAVIFLLFFGWKTWQAWLAVLLCAISAYARMYVGVHFPIDVLVGLTLGIVSALFCWKYVHQQPLKKWESATRTWYSIAAILLGLLAILAFNYRVQPQTAQSMHMWIPIIVMMMTALLWKKRFAN